MNERKYYTSFLVAIVLFLSVSWQATAYPFPVDISGLFNCSENEVYNPIEQGCSPCPLNAERVDGKCKCYAGFAMMTYAGEDKSTCVNCAIQSKVVSPLPGINGSYFCVDCSKDTDFPETDAFYNEEMMKCECVNENSSLVDIINGIPRSSQSCIPCTTSPCLFCKYPYTEKGDHCECVPGFVLLADGSCISNSIYDEMVAVANETTMDYSSPNIDNTNKKGSMLPFAYDKVRITMAAAACDQNNQTECQFLSNMCVLMNYAKESTPCALYLYLKQKGTCEDEFCEKTKDLPWLYYLESSADIMSKFDLKVQAWESFSFVVSVYDEYGNWLGMKPLVDELNVCRQPNTVVETFLKAGGSLQMTCNINWKWFLVAERTEFYELFLVNPSNSSDLLPIPVLLDFTATKFHPLTLLDPFFYRPGWSLFDTSSPAYAPSNGYHRRFYVYDNVATRDASVGYPSSVTATRSISLIVGSLFRSGVNTPIFVLQYESHNVQKYQQSVSNGFLQLPLSSSSSSDTMKENVRMYFLNYSSTLDTALMTLLIVFCGLCFLTSLVRMYGYMRRRQNLVLDVPAILVCIIYFLDHLSNCFLFISSLTSWTLLVLYKSQHWLVIALKERETYLVVLLSVSIAAKGIVVIYRVLEQCNADYYIIDWERSKGQLLRENSLVPVSMWRSNFLAHQLNLVQCMRYIHPLVVMLIVSFFLIGLHYSELSKGAPKGSRYSTDSALSLETLRIAVDTFFWCAVSFLLYVLEFQIYYRFFVVHPLQAFVDLCSVSNISVLILLEPMWGFYIHGRSIHAHADVNMEEFQKNLALEAEGNLPVRGLGGQSQCQTFEVFLGPYMRQYLYMCQIEMMIQHQKDGAIKKVTNPAAWHVLECVSKRKSEVYSKEAMVIKDQVNQALQRTVHRAEGSLFSKMTLHKLLNFPPNIMYMNGAQRGDRGSKDLFFFDQNMSFERAFMCSLDFDLFVLYTGLFAAIDAAIENVFISMLVTAALEFLFQMYRTREGRANFCIKTLINECFL